MQKPNKEKSAPSKGIAFFFNKQATPKSVNCPVCDIQVPLKQINAHLDSALCKGQINFEDESDDNDKSERHKNDDIEEIVIISDGEESSEKENTEKKALLGKRKLSQNEDLESEAKRQKSLESFNSFSSDNDDDDDELLQIANDASNDKPDEIEETITLSQSISYNPLRFGGMESLKKSPGSSQGTQKIVTSGSKRASQKYSPFNRSKSLTPKKETNFKRNLFTPEPCPDMPDHDPYTPSKKLDLSYVPYYVTNFEYIIQCVIDCTDDRDLFNDNDLEIVAAYRKMSLMSRKLYCRLFNRKHAWLPSTSIRYEEIPHVESSAEELLNVGLLQDKTKLDEIAQVLAILPASDIKQLGKEYHVEKKATTKCEIISELLKQTKRKSAMSSFFKGGQTMEKLLLKRALSFVGSCLRLEPESRSVMVRVLCLWGIARWWEDREGDRPPSTLTALLLANQGRITYPEYFIQRKTKVLRNREDVLLFEEALRLEGRLQEAVTNKDWDEGYLVYQMLKVFYDKLESDVLEHVKQLPGFLRRFTAPVLAVFGLSKCVDLLEKMKRHGEAVELLENLLEGDLLGRYRGLWWERLTLDLEQHLRKPEKALDKLEKALEDKDVREGRRLALCRRVAKICKAKKNVKICSRLESFSCSLNWVDPCSDDLPSVAISGKLLPRDNVSGSKSVFIVTSPGGGVTYCSVEELVRSHYREAGFLEGVHGESAVFGTVLAIVFWDIIYLTDVPDAFRGPAQSAPLDWDSDDFYAARKDAIDARLEEVAGMGKEGVEELIVKGWEEHAGVSSVAGWDWFRSGQHLASLVRCIQPKTLSRVLGRLIRDHRATRSGFPDLTVWNPGTNELRVVEVKGPSDVLSTKQILWIRFLNEVGITTEVCYVDPTGSRVAGSATKNKKTPQKKASPSKESPVKERKKEKTKVKRKLVVEDDSESEFDMDSLVYDELRDSGSKTKSKVGDNKSKSKMNSSTKSKSKNKPHKLDVNDSDPDYMESGSISAKSGELKKAKRKKRVAS